MSYHESTSFLANGNDKASFSGIRKHSRSCRSSSRSEISRDCEVYDEALQVEFGTLEEQEDEQYYDDRLDCDDDLEKGRIKFPRKLYGRDQELAQLHQIYKSLLMESGSTSNKSHVVLLKGYSGTGKAALAGEFVRQVRKQQQQPTEEKPKQQQWRDGDCEDEDCSDAESVDVTDTTSISIKFDELHAGDPFYSIQNALDDYVQRLSKHLSQEEFESLYKRLKRVDLGRRSHDATVLVEALIPSLLKILEKGARPKSVSTPATASNSSQGTYPSALTVRGAPCSVLAISAFRGTDTATIQEAHTMEQPPQPHIDLNAVKLSLCHFVEAVAKFLGQPMIWFLEDLQWANETSFQLMSGLIMAQEKSAPSILWIASYPSSPTVSPASAPNINDQKIPQDSTTVLDKFLTLLAAPSDEMSSSACVTTATPPPVTRLELFNLTPNDICLFLADCIDKSEEEVQPLAEAMYAKTLGNMFHVKQALEELVRQNALYYDVISFEWTVAINSVEHLEQLWADAPDIIAMVQRKLQNLPPPLPWALAVAAYTNHFIDLNLLYVLLSLDSGDANATKVQSITQLHELMEVAFEKGMVLHVAEHDPHSASTTPATAATFSCYKFAHDRIQEAARATVPEGPERDQLLVRISKVLLDTTVVLGPLGARRSSLSHVSSGAISKSSTMTDWRLFSAARNLNSVSPTLTNPIELCQLNLTVGKLAAQRGAFHEAVIFLQAGAARLDPAVCWSDPAWYPLTLDLKTLWVEAEHFLGHENLVLEICKEIFGHAKTMAEKSRAHVCYVEAMNGILNNSHSESCDIALDVLELYGMSMPRKPSRGDVRAEKWRLLLALKGRPYLCMALFPVATDPAKTAQVRVACMALNWAAMSHQVPLVDILTRRVLRLTMQDQVITKDLPLVLCWLGFNFRREERYNDVIAFTNAAVKIVERFPQERGLEFIKAKYTSVLLNCIRSPFRDAMDDLLQLCKILLSKGESMYGNGCALCAMLGYFLSSLRLDSMFENKLQDLEDRAISIGRRSFAVLFALFRQSLYNLQGGPKASQNPCEVNGAAYNEEQVQSSLEGDARKMNNRDIGILRLMLAVIFDDETTMDEMLIRLDAYPTFDLILHREHMRMAWTGFAALILKRRRKRRQRQVTNSSKQRRRQHETNGGPENSNEDYKKYNKWIKMASGYFSKLARCGSANAQPVFACFNALKNPSVAAFDEAIHMCADQALLNLCAFMHEHWGFMLFDQQQEQQPNEVKKEVNAAAEEQLRCALWLYHDWGAYGKVAQLQSRHNFLGGSSVFHQQAPPSQLSALKRRATSIFTQSVSNDFNLYPIESTVET